MTKFRPNPVVIANDAVDQLVAFCQAQQLQHLLVVSDHNTEQALGVRVTAALHAAGFDVKRTCFDQGEVVADADHVFRVLLNSDNQPRTYIAVGAGTLTDITRFVSQRTHSDFIGMPTAPSVDGFTSIGAPLIIDGVKVTVICQPPRAIFADLAVLVNAPRAMIAAGFGDMLGKFTSVADFRLGRLLWDEPYDEEIATRTWRVAQQCLDHAAEIGTATPAGVRLLMEALIESGYCMLDFGDSRPASGTEHHYSHYWEMKLLHEGRPAILHGAKVGFATILTTQIYERLGKFSRTAIADALEAALLPDPATEIAQIEAAYGKLAAEVMKIQRPFLTMDEGQFDRLKQRILYHWEEIQAIGAALPASSTCQAALQQVGGPTSGAALGLSDAEVAAGAAAGHYLRNRFTVRKLVHYLGMEGE